MSKKRPAAAGLKRPAAKTSWEVLLQTKVSYDGSGLSREEFLSTVKSWVSGSVKDQAVAASHQLYEHGAKPGHFKYKWRCTSCTSCSWRCVSQWDPKTSCLTIRGTPLSSHGDFARQWPGYDLELASLSSVV